MDNFPDRGSWTGVLRVQGAAQLFSYPKSFYHDLDTGAYEYGYGGYYPRDADGTPWVLPGDEGEDGGMIFVLDNGDGDLMSDNRLHVRDRISRRTLRSLFISRSYVLSL
eukprot:675204-Hanusia_phi.AAC.8